MSSLRERKIKEIWDRADKHYIASHAGVPGDMEQYELCQCCDQPVVKQPMSMWQNTKQFQIFGFGYPLFYSFLKYCIILVLVLIASRTGSEIYMATKQNYDFCYGGHDLAETNGHPHHFSGHDLTEGGSLRTRHYEEGHHPRQEKQNGHSAYPSQKSIHSQHPSSQSSHQAPSGHQQHHAQCTSFMVYLSIFKGEQTYNNYFLRILSFVIHLVALIGIRNNLLKEEQYYDERTCSLSDYSIIVSNLPQTHGVKKMVIKLFEKEFNKTYGSKDSDIVDTLYIFESKRLKALQKQKHQLQKKKLKAIGRNDESEINQIERQIEKSQHQIKERLEKLHEDITYDQIKCDKMIIIMNTEGDKGQVLQSFENGKENGRDYSEYFTYIDHKTGENKKVKIEIKQAPEPNEINWKHIDQSDTRRKFLILRGWIFTLLFLAIVTVAFYFIMLAKTNLFVSAIELEHHNPNDPSVKSKKTFATIIVFVALFGVILFNKFIMGKVLHKFVHMQRHAYTDKQGHSFAMKYSLGMFFTTALMTLAVEAITYKNFYSHQYGVIEQESIMFFVTAFFIPAVWLINPYDVAKKIEYHMKKNTLVLQQKANELVEDFPYDLGKRYAQVFEIMWFTFLYSELIPMGSFLVLIGLFLYFWVDKFNFLRRSAYKGGVSGKMSLLSLKSLDATLFLAPAGRVLFSYVMHNQVDYLAIILTVLGIIYLFVPISEIIWTLNGEKFILQERTYQDAKYRFREHYYTFHPVYRQTHREEISNFRESVRKYYKQQFKKSHHIYIQGRGNYKKEDEKSNTSRLKN